MKNDGRNKDTVVSDIQSHTSPPCAALQVTYFPLLAFTLKAETRTLETRDSLLCFLLPGDLRSSVSAQQHQVKSEVEAGDCVVVVVVVVVVSGEAALSCRVESLHCGINEDEKL